MRIFVFSRGYHSDFRSEIQTIIDVADRCNGHVLFPASLQQEISQSFNLPPKTTFLGADETLHNKADLVISLGGDGTLLETLNIIRDSQIPVMGVNFGRLGFLSNTSREEFRMALESFSQGHFSLSHRTVLSIDQSTDLFGREVFALNEIALYKKDSSSMISVQTLINNEFMNTYWSDGVIVATPTGSTAYSLSCGGPVLVPAARNLILTPIAPHNLSVRPVVISDDDVVTLIPEGRADQFVLSLDSMQAVIHKGQMIQIRKAPFTMNFVKQAGDTFFRILREKLMWGEDKRNL